jgi:hypothetical protein
MDVGNNSLKSISDKDEGTGEGWDNELCYYLKGISDKCIEFRNIHEDSAILYEKRFHYFSLSLIVISFVNSALDIAPYENVIYSYFITIISVLISTLATINKFLKYQEYSTKHRIGSQTFLKLYQNITEEFLQEKKLRINGIRYAKWVGKNFAEIRESLPFPPQVILDKLKLNNNPTIKLKKNVVYSNDDIEMTRINIQDDNNVQVGTRSMNEFNEFKNDTAMNEFTELRNERFKRSRMQQEFMT